MMSTEYRTHHPWAEPGDPLPQRRINVPGDVAPLMVGVLLDLRAVEWEGRDIEVVLPPPGGRGIAPAPDVPRMSHREYGHRVGVFRMLRELSARRIPTAVAMDALTATHYQPVVEAVMEAGAEIVAGGLSGSRAITSRMSRGEEEDYIASALAGLEAATGERPQGWLSVEHSQSERTPTLLAAAGLTHLLDFGNDEQPYPLLEAAPLWAVPVSWELSDLAAVFHRAVTPRTYGRSLVQATEQLASDGDVRPRILVMHLHPWLSGQPGRVGSVLSAFDRIGAIPGVHWTTPRTMLEVWSSPG